jgi:hypothetical protein
VEQLDFTRPELWRPSRRWPGYEVSDKGRFRSADRLVTPARRQRPYWLSGKTLGQSPDEDGYLRAMVYIDGKRSHAVVHLAVLEEFAGPRPAGQEARHGPHGRAVNWWPENLCWGTKSANNGADKIRDGTLPLGERNRNAKLTEAIVREIRRRRAAGEMLAAIAADYGVGHTTVQKVAAGETWRHVR